MKTFTAATGRRRGCALVCALLPVVVEANEVQSERDVMQMSVDELMSIEVSGASKFLQKTTEAPANVTIITADDIRRFGYRTLADTLNSVRGMNVSYDRNYSYLGVRGSGRAGDFNSRMLLLVDGYRLNDNIYDQAYLGTDFPLDIALIDRIEVVRGPGSSIYGSNAVLGIINIVTKRGGDLDGFETSAELASFGTDKERMSYGKRYESGVELLLSASRYHSTGQDLYFPEFNTPVTGNGIARSMDDDRYGSFFVNNAAAQGAGLRISSKLLKLARIVPPGGGGK